MSAPANLLEHYAAPLAAWLGRDDVNEVVVNPDGAIWVESSGAAHMQDAGVRMTANDVRQLAKIVAGEAKLTLSEKTPLVSADMRAAGGLARIQVATPPAAAGVGAVAIRRLGVTRISLDAMGFLDPEKVIASGDAELGELKEVRDLLAHGALSWPKLARIATERRWNVLFSGGTSSGKTTQAKAMLDAIPNAERVITIEDVSELKAPQPNAVSLIADRAEGSGRTPIDLMEAVLRLRPDRFIMGEIRGADAAAYMEVINTGHPGSICTMHANSPADAVARLSKMVRRGAPGVTDGEVRDDIRRTIHIIVQTVRDGERRGISRVMFPPLEQV